MEVGFTVSEDALGRAVWILRRHGPPFAARAEAKAAPENFFAFQGDAEHRDILEACRADSSTGPELVRTYVRDITAA